MNFDKKIFNFGIEQCEQLFPEYEPFVINNILESSSLRLLDLISSLYNGYSIYESDEKRYKILKNLVAEFYIIPIMSELYPEVLNLIDSFDDFLQATAILNKVICVYNEILPRPSNINCSMFNINEKMARKILMNFGYSEKIYNDKTITKNLMYRINDILNSNSTTLYFLAHHYFGSRKSLDLTLKNLNYLEFFELFEDICEDEIMESVSNEIIFFNFIESSGGSINKLLVSHIVKCYNDSVKF